MNGPYPENNWEWQLTDNFPTFASKMHSDESQFKLVFVTVPEIQPHLCRLAGKGVTNGAGMLGVRANRVSDWPMSFSDQYTSFFWNLNMWIANLHPFHLPFTVPKFNSLKLDHHIWQSISHYEEEGLGPCCSQTSSWLLFWIWGYHLPCEFTFYLCKSQYT